MILVVGWVCLFDLRRYQRIISIDSETVRALFQLQQLGLIIR